MCEDDPRLAVDDCEFHRTEKGYTYESMETIQEKHPDETLIVSTYERLCTLVEELLK